MSKNPQVHQISRFGALFENSKKILKRGFLAMTKKSIFQPLEVKILQK
jgi:hypothetical protein